MIPFKEPVEILTVLVLLALLVPRAARRLGIPSIVGLIIAGVLVGPHGLNFISDHEGIKFFSDAGLLLIMFLAGLEMNLSEVQRRPQSTLIFGGFTFFIPWLTGMVLGRYVFGFPWLVSVLLGSLFSSHTLLPYPIVSRMGLTRDPAVNATTGGTILTDTLALLVLAVTARIHRGDMTVLYGVELLVGGTILVAVSIYLLPRFGRWYYRRLPLGEDTAEFLFLFANLLLFSWLAHVAGLEPIIGAFLAGMALNPLVPQKGRLMNRVQFVGNSLFIPIFLISVGMIVNLRDLLFAGLGWEVALGMTAAVLSAKYLAAVATRFVSGYTRIQAMIIYGLSVNQAAATLAAVMVGHNIGLLSDAVLNGTILMILATCIVGPWVTEVCGRRYALGLSRSVQQTGSGPRRIMMAVTREEEVNPLVDTAVMIRESGSDHPIHPLSVAIEGPGVNEQLANYEKLLGMVVVQATTADVPVQAEARIDTNEAAGIDRAARELRISCLLTAWDGRVGGGNAVFGRIIDRILAQVRRLTLVIFLQQPLNTFKRLVLVLPRMADRLPGYIEAIRLMENMLGRSGLNLLIIAPEGERERIEKVFKKLSSDTKWELYKRFSDILTVLEGQVRDNDLLTVFSCRADSLVWQPGLARMPQRLRAKHKGTSLLFVYPSELLPSETFGAEDVAAGAVRRPARLLNSEGFFPDLGQLGAAEAVREQLRRYTGVLKQLNERRLDILTAQLMPTALEIQPGMVIMHVHCALTQVPRVLLGSSREGVRFPDIDQPVKVIFILLSPEDAPPEQHLRALGDLAHLIMAMPDADAIAEVTSFNDLLQLSEGTTL